MVKTKDSTSNLSVMILAAGLGKRMCSPLPKVLHELCGKPLLYHVLFQVHQVLPNASVAIIVGYGREEVEAYVRSEPLFKNLRIQFVFQPQQKGTGHAARCAMESGWGKEQISSKNAVLVLPGDLPLIRPGLFEKMTQPLKKQDALRLLVCELSHPTGYGRVVRKRKNGPVLRIVEEKDATPSEKAIREVATSIYLFRPDFLMKALGKLSSKNAQSEYYLTDVISTASKAGKGVDTLMWSPSEDLQGVNDPWELALAEEILNQRLIQAWALKGVRVMDPKSIRLDVSAQLGERVVIYPGAIVSGETRVGSGVVLGPRVYLKNVDIGENAVIKAGTVAERATIGPRAQVGPYAHLRPETALGASVKIGNFVELKKSRVDENTSIAHLSYIGDAEVGRDVNIGCGFVTCNYDGRIIQGERKHKTIIEDEVFLGSDCQAVAPVRIGKGAFVASGSTITKDVPPDDLAIARSRQVNKPGYARKLKNLKEE